VVGQSEGTQAFFYGIVYQFCGSESAIGAVGMYVEIDHFLFLSEDKQFWREIILTENDRPAASAAGLFVWSCIIQSMNGV
jgi:hypothetical protein